MNKPGHAVAIARWQTEGVWRQRQRRSQVRAVRNKSSINNASIPDLRNVAMASLGVQTIGSLSLKDVLMTSGTPVFAKNRDMSS